MDVSAAPDVLGQSADRRTVFFHCVAGSEVRQGEFVAEGNSVEQDDLLDLAVAADTSRSRQGAKSDRHVVAGRDLYGVPGTGVAGAAHSDGPIRVKHSEPCPAASPQVSVPEATSSRAANKESAASSSDIRA